MKHCLARTRVLIEDEKKDPFVIGTFERVAVYGGHPGKIQRGMISGQIITHKICPQKDVSRCTNAELEGAYMGNMCAIPCVLFKLGRYQKLDPLWNAQIAHNYAAHLAFFAFKNPSYVALPPNSQDVTGRNIHQTQFAGVTDCCYLVTGTHR